jgi:hypothetical protein
MAHGHTILRWSASRTAVGALGNFSRENPVP